MIKDPAVFEKIEKALQSGHVSIIELVNNLIEIAHNLRASDIHISPETTDLQVRFRIDGVMHDQFVLPKTIHAEVISRIKIMAGMRTDEHQSAQDGRFGTIIEKEAIDIRVSIAPTYHGENAVMRLLSDKAEEFTLASLGFSKANQEKILKALKKPFGMILATGPTGSGKTTTLYTILKLLNTQEVSIVTIEDPIEYSLEGIDQIGVNPRTGLTFANGLRSILRQDPNIIMVGEIRDADTAGIAVNTALTGHVLLSTIHTNDAATTLPRLLDLKVEPYLIASTVNIAIGQRLVRKICNHCKTEYKLSVVERKSLSDAFPAKDLKTLKFYKGEGCDECNQTGYSGRVGIHEVLVVDNSIRDAILKKESASDLHKTAVENGMAPMVLDGLEKAALGITTLEEVLRMLHE